MQFKIIIKLLIVNILVCLPYSGKIHVFVEEASWVLEVPPAGAEHSNGRKKRAGL
jgi:hypothetical protein